MRKKENIDSNWIWEVCWMRNRVKKFKISVPSIIKTVMVFPMICGALFCVPAYALDSDLSYNYKTENQEEFVIVGKSNINIQGRDLHDERCKR